MNRIAVVVIALGAGVIHGVLVGAGPAPLAAVAIATIAGAVCRHLWKELG